MPESVRTNAAESPSTHLSAHIMSWRLSNIARAVAILPIRLYRKVLGPVLPKSCRFYPSCSHYAEEAILRHGIIRGIALGTWRLLRCQPLCKGGEDLVPPVRVS